MTWETLTTARIVEMDPMLAPFAPIVESALVGMSTEARRVLDSRLDAWIADAETHRDPERFWDLVSAFVGEMA